MSYIVYRDVFDMNHDDPLIGKIDKLDDEIIRRYQQGYVDDEFTPGMTIEEAEAYYKENGYTTWGLPYPGSFDALLILYKMIQSGEVKFDVQ